MPSLRSKLFEAYLWLTGAKAVTNMIDLVYPLDATHAKPTRGMRRRVSVAEAPEGGRTVYTVAPLGGAGPDHVLFLHGGAYYNGFAPPHWLFVEDVVTRARCTVTAPDYPLAPDAGVDDIFGMVMPLYRRLAAGGGAGRLTVVGDSSGGGMALALAQKARDAGLPQPKGLILLSPWLDVTMSNPGVAAVDGKDPYIGLHACVSAGRRYAAGDDPRRPDISPIYGTLDRLGPVTTFVGTHDIMLPDCRRLRAMAERAGVKYRHIEYEDMVHVWVLLSLPESVRARGEICQVINGSGRRL